MRAIVLGGLFALLLNGNTVLAAPECPNAQTAKDGLRLVTRGAVSEVRQQSDLVVQVASYFDDGEAQTAQFFRGLIEITRVSKSKQTYLLALSDLRSLFPLKKGQRKKFVSIWLDSRGAPSPPETTELFVAGQELLKIGPCEYSVLRIETRLLGKDGSKQLLESVLYSPNLAVILAKRYDEGTSQESTVGYQEIKPLK